MSEERPSRWRLGRVAGLVVLAPVAFAAAVTGVFVSRIDLRVLGVPVPVGLALGLGAAVGAFRIADLILARWGTLVAVVAWALGVVAFMWPRPEGDIVLANDWHGLGFLLLATVVVVWYAARALRGRV